MAHRDLASRIHVGNAPKADKPEPTRMTHSGGKPTGVPPRGLVLPLRRVGPWISIHFGGFVSRRARRPQARIPHPNRTGCPLRRCPRHLLVPVRASPLLFAVRDCEPGILGSGHSGPRPENAPLRDWDMDAGA